MSKKSNSNAIAASATVSSKKSSGAGLHLLDKKLLPRIEQYLRTLGPSSAPSVDDIVTYLREKYTEYKRQPLTTVTNFVEATIEYKQKQVKQQSAIDVEIMSSAEESNSNVNNPHKKRRRQSNIAQDGNESSSTEEEEDVELIQVEDKNLANSSLRTLYKTPSKANEANSNESTANPNKAVNRKKLKQRRNRGNGEPSLESIVAASNQNEMNWHPEIIRSSVRYSQLGGIESILQDIREQIEYPLTHPEIYQHLGVEPPRGILLHGPPGCGKFIDI
jgi:ribosome biogenesis ATPase